MRSKWMVFSLVIILIMLIIGNLDMGKWNGRPTPGAYTERNRTS